MVGSTDCQQDCQHKSIYRLCSKPIGSFTYYIFVYDTQGELYIFAQVLLVMMLRGVVGVNPYDSYCCGFVCGFGCCCCSCSWFRC